MEQNGYIKIYRKSLLDGLFNQKPFDKWHAWVYLLLHAKYKDGIEYVNNRKIDTKRGCVYISQDNLAKEWGWSKCKVLRFISILQDEGMVILLKSHTINCISIVSYDKYQNNDTTNDTTDSTTNDTTNDTTPTSFNKKKRKNISPLLSPQGDSEVEEDAPKVDYAGIVNFYNKCVEGKQMPKCIKLTRRREKAINARLNQFGIDGIYEAIRNISESDYCNGGNDRSWKADFDFVFSENNMAKILEGKYKNRKEQPKEQELDPMDKKTASFLGYAKEHYPRIYPALEKQGRYFFELAYNIADKNSNYLNQIVSQMNDQSITENILDRFKEIYDNGRNEGKFPSAYDLMKQRNEQT